MSEELLAERYGKRGKHRQRWMRYGIPLAGLLVGALIAFVAYTNLGTEPLSTTVKQFAPSGEHSMRVTFTLTRDQPDRAADCVVTASLADATELGRKEVYIPPGSETRKVTAHIRTAKRAAKSEVYGCSYNIPKYLEPTTGHR